MDLRKAFPRIPQIIIADDDWLNRDLLKTYLVSAGCDVADFPDGQKAWDAIEAGLIPDLALLDIQMPHLDGVSLCAKLKNDERTQLIPVIIVTALDAEDEKLRAIEAGADDFITKPFNSVILLTRVRSLLRIKHLTDEVEKRNALLRTVLNRYVDEEITNVILTDPERHLQLGGDTRHVTILFADLRGFTRFTETHPANEVVKALNMVFQQLTDVVYTHGGTFDKYMGDSILAFYGAPVEGEKDVERAIQTAIEMQTRFIRLQSTGSIVKTLSGLGIGIHYGEAIVGNIGSERVMDYTVIGDTVNVARRLQEVAGPGQIFISEATLEQVPNARTKKLKPTALPGREEPIMIYSLLGLK